MATNGAKGGGRNGAVKDRSQFQNPKNGNWTKRDASSGRFMAMKRTGGPVQRRATRALSCANKPRSWAPGACWLVGMLASFVSAWSDGVRFSALADRIATLKFGESPHWSEKAKTAGQSAVLRRAVKQDWHKLGSQNAVGGRIRREMAVSRGSERSCGNKVMSLQRSAVRPVHRSRPKLWRRTRSLIELERTRDVRLVHHSILRVSAQAARFLPMSLASSSRCCSLPFTFEKPATLLL